MFDEKGLTKLVINNLQKGFITKEAAIELIQYISESNEEQVAVIGMGCIMPDTDDYNGLWANLLENNSLIAECPKNRLQLVKDILGRKDGENLGNYHKGAFYDYPDMFDYSLFEMTKEEAVHMDPAQRIMLMTAYRTLEDAGYLGEKNIENDTVVYIANNFTNAFFLSYLTLCGYGNFDAILRNWSSGLATRLSHYFNLKGMSVTCDNSCASGATAILNAANMIKNGECKSALIGGISNFITPDKVVTMDWVFNHGKDAVTRPFDKQSEGMYFGEGCAALYLKSLKQALIDGDRIHAIIRGGAINNNGRNGEFSKSSVNDVKQVMLQAISKARINVRNLGYLESEGYIERMEEAIQFRGLSDGIHQYTEDKQFCAIGVTSPNLGYLQAASGIVNSMKCIMALKNKKLPPLRNFERPSELIHYINSAFYMNDQVRDWNMGEEQKRIAATYANGFGGNNVVIFYEEYTEEPRAEEEEHTKELFLFSGATEFSFYAMLDKYIEFLSHTTETLRNICYTAAVGRKHYTAYRCSVTASDKEQLVDILNKIKRGAATGSTWEAGQVNTRLSAGLRLTNQRLMQQAIREKDYEAVQKYYCEGNDGIYHELYEGKSVRVCCLPFYTFDLSSCWVKRKNIMEENQ